MPPFTDDCIERESSAVASDPLDSWLAFSARVRKRLEAGRAAYGDKSFERPPGELLEELQCEALDLAGWGFILFERIERLRRRLP